MAARAPGGPLRTLAFTAAALACAGAAAAQPTVSPLTVPGGPAPRVAASYPAQGEAVPDGVLVLKVAFDLPMKGDAWAFGAADGGAFPACLARPRLLNDGKTFVLLCTVEPGKAYAVALNASPRFVSSAGRPAEPYVLKFTTTDVDTRDLPTAIANAGLTEHDSPVMNWRDDGKGVGATPEPQ